MVKNLNNPRQATRGVSVGPKFSFKSTKQIYILVSNKNGAITSGKKKQIEVSRHDVSNSNPFDAFNSIENDDDLGTNGGISKLAGTRSLNVAHGSSSNTPIIDKIYKLKRQILDGKLILWMMTGTRLFLRLVGTMEGNKQDNDYDPYNEDLYESHDMSDHLAICDYLDIMIHSRKKK
ncbi:hypothetical protein Tco_0871373 [Tanacetum coccineum]